LHRRPSITAIVKGTLTVALASFSLGSALAASAPVALAVSHGSSHHSAARSDTETSTNWSGYADQTTARRKFTDVAGSWTEPKATCSTTGSHPYASFWVGIDGYSSNSVEQLGTDSDCWGKTPVYYAWWEMYPAGSSGLSQTRYPVKPGDRLRASVSVANGRFTLTLTSSEGWRFSTVRRGAAGLKQSSAEWIAEAPEVGNSTAALTHFASFRFSRCVAATNYGSATAIASSNRSQHRLFMVSNRGVRMATPTTLSPTGNDFTVTWDHS
jgi:hypothetical protein